MELKFPESEAEDLIERCGGCKWCFFEYILQPEQRKKKVLKQPIPEKHIHRDLIEELCGMQKDEVCAMKYAAMRAGLTPYAAVQIGLLKILAYDLGKESGKEVSLDEAGVEWIKRGHAPRFRDVWKAARREENVGEKDLILRVRGYYEICVASPEVYSIAMGLMGLLKNEYEKRRDLGK